MQSQDRPPGILTSRPTATFRARRRGIPGGAALVSADLESTATSLPCVHWSAACRVDGVGSAFPVAGRGHKRQRIVSGALSSNFGRNRATGFWELPIQSSASWSSVLNPPKTLQNGVWKLGIFVGFSTLKWAVQN